MGIRGRELQMSSHAQLRKQVKRAYISQSQQLDATKKKRLTSCERNFSNKTAETGN